MAPCPGGFLCAAAFALAQEDDDEETTEADDQSQAAEAEDSVETVVVTGSRIARVGVGAVAPTSSCSTKHAIRATGEFTLPRVLQQLPQNANPTNATYVVRGSTA